MKKLYVLAGALFVASGAFAQSTGGHELFFSAYNEGAHPSTGPNNIPPGGGTPSQGSERALQIFNPTNTTINLDAYSVARYSNGSTTVFQEEKVKRTIPASAPNTLTQGDVFVIGAFKATLTDIVNNMDQRSSDYGPITNSTVIVQGGPVTFDGNDAMVLRRWTSGIAGTGTPVIVDIIGVIGENPGNIGWLTNTVVGGQTMTVKTTNQSLNRIGSIENGVRTTDSTTYEIGNEWEVYSAWNGVSDPAGYFGQSYANLAGHASRYTGTYGAYGPLGVLEDFNKAITVYPNPTANKEVKIRIENTKVASISILNALGQNVKVSPATAAQGILSVDVSSLKPGLYFVKFVAGDEFKTTIYKELLVQ